jgi:hypothetical protein
MKFIRVTMPDGSRWDVPAARVADDMALHRSKADLLDTMPMHEHTTAFQEEFHAAMADHDDLLDWASNNMDWSDVVRVAQPVQEATEVDYQEGWMNGDKQIVDRPILGEPGV